ncbi:uncharacterized protein RJT20DRAFT_59104 [Scheffersomyces xylosifermentans]|uniref:uncharacterized protein n=1 Tax=Scheffersomyces xylosifermentans TaxID=1304137 RepID=UPI00315DA050
MSNDFLQSSPSRNIIDPLIYNNFESEDKRGSSSNKNSITKLSPSNSNGNTNNNTNQQQMLSSVPPSASKFFNNNTNLTGWTPLITKTYYNDQILSFNTTPNKYVIPPGATASANQDYMDYSQGLNLTPFLTHNLNMASSTNINHHLSNITPFHDKTLHLADFFMDSPIRQTPVKDLDTITPSKFKIGSAMKSNANGNKSIFSDPKSASKRSITQVDTPPRQPHKLSITTKAMIAGNDDDDVTDCEEKDENENEKEDEKENRTKGKESRDRYYLQTPSKKVLGDASNTMNTKTPRNNTKKNDATNFQTPSKPISASSPSTVIMSSATKSPTPTNNKVEEYEGNDDGDDTCDEGENNKENIRPPLSPTPNKELKSSSIQPVVNDDLKPAMGVFSEKKTLPVIKSKSKNKYGYSGHSRSNSSYNGKFGSKPEDTDGTHNKLNNRTRMQAGMNKFQIIFTDVHTLMNNKNKKKGTNGQANSSSSTANSGNHKSRPAAVDKPPSATSQKNSTRSTAPIAPQHQQQQHHHPHHHHQQNASATQPMVYVAAPPHSQLHNLPVSTSSSSSSNPSSQEHNVSMNTSKEISIISGGSNTSNLNITSNTDHSSFEVGGLSSTPNGKFFLDKMFEKQSPQSQHLMNQANAYYMSQHGAMPPPGKQHHQQHMSSQQHQAMQQQMLHPHQSNQSQQPMMMMMMSTPQHQNVVNYSPQIYGNVMSPSGDTSGSNDSQQMNGFSFPGYQQFSKDMNSTPQNYSIINLNGQSVMMPMMMNAKPPFGGVMHPEEDLLKEE